MVKNKSSIEPVQSNVTVQDNPIGMWNKIRWLALPVLLVIATFAVSLEYGFVSDDRAFFLSNSNLLKQQVTEYFTSGVWEFSSFDISKGQLYRPMALLNYRAQLELWGSNPFGFHLVNVLAHVMVTVLVFILLSFLVPPATGRALALATSIFAVHPVQVETVSWILGNNDIWAALWSFLGILLLVHAQGKKRLYMVASAMLAILAAMLTKEVAYTLPGLLAIVFLIREETIGRKQIVQLISLSGALLMFVLILRSNAVVAPELAFNVEGFKKLFVYFLGYLKMTLLPLPQRFYLVEPVGGMVALWELLLGITVFSGFVLLIWKIKEGRRFFILSAGWYGFVLAPALLVAFHSIRSTFANRIIYLAIFSLSMIVLWLMTHSSEARRKFIERVVAAVVVLYTLTSIWMGSAWKDQATFIQLALASTPETLSLYNDKGDYYAEVGEIDEAIASYKIAAKESANEKTKILAHTRLGEIYAKTKAFDNARREFETVLVIEPENTIAIVGLGNVAWLLDDLVSAEKYYEMALLLYPDHTIASKNLVAVRELLSSDN